MNPRYHVYVISKGRWENPLTANALEYMRVPYYIVVEPQEAERYRTALSHERILTLPFSNLGQGSIPARNWVWQHSIESGESRHWILDDNIDGFVRLKNNKYYPVSVGTCFRVIEDFTDRYENVALSGMHYRWLAKRKQVLPPFYLNRRVYSCILVRNDLEHRWRGRYNEDTDLSLRVLKDGWCTILFIAFLCNKATTMTMRGGNTDDLYKGDGRLRMAESLCEQHPDVCKINWKWGRWQHEVDYRQFKKNKLVFKPTYVPTEGINEYSLTLRETQRERRTFSNE